MFMNFENGKIMLRFFFTRTILKSSKTAHIYNFAVNFLLGLLADTRFTFSRMFLVSSLSFLTFFCLSVSTMDNGFYCVVSQPSKTTADWLTEVGVTGNEWQDRMRLLKLDCLIHQLASRTNMVYMPICCKYIYL